MINVDRQKDLIFGKALAVNDEERVFVAAVTLKAQFKLMGLEVLTSIEEQLEVSVDERSPDILVAFINGYFLAELMLSEETSLLNREEMQ